MSEILSFLYNLYDEANEFIRKEIESHFMTGFLFVLLWIFILGIIVGLLLITAWKWKITAWIFGILIAIEVLCYIGEKLKR